MRHLPNIISILRILLVFPTAYFLWNERYAHALLVFLIAGVSDGVDGALARYYGWSSRLGMFLDPLGDKFLMVASYLVLGLMSLLPMWLVALVIGRDVFISLGALIYRWWIESVPMSPLFISKINTVAQITLVLLVIYKMSALPLSNLLSASLMDYLIYLVALTTVLSGMSYLVVWGRRALSHLSKRHAA